MISTKQQVNDRCIDRPNSFIGSVMIKINDEEVVVPVDADCSQVENGRRAAHDVQRHPRVTQGIAKFPVPSVHLPINNDTMSV